MILVLSDDLLDASRTVSHGRAAGVTVVQCRTLDVLRHQLAAAEVVCCIIDLQFPKLNLTELVGYTTRDDRRPRLVGYGSHVDAKRLSEARHAGFDDVMPRSKYFDTLAERMGEYAG